LLAAIVPPVNGLAIFALAGFLALRSRRYLPARKPPAAQAEARTQGSARPVTKAPV
jgi:hypothetical protein